MFSIQNALLKEHTHDNKEKYIETNNQTLTANNIGGNKGYKILNPDLSLQRHF
jgi:hypothetical protein